MIAPKPDFEFDFNFYGRPLSTDQLEEIDLIDTDAALDIIIKKAKVIEPLRLLADKSKKIAETIFLEAQLLAFLEGADSEIFDDKVKEGNNGPFSMNDLAIQSAIFICRAGIIDINVQNQVAMTLAYYKGLKHKK